MDIQQVLAAPNDHDVAVISAIASVAALIIAIVALVYTAKTYFLKSGFRARGFCSIGSSIYCDDMYISKIIVENLKDRAIVVFQILLEIDYGYYIVVENFEDSPLILKPFEAYAKEYDPIDYYAVSLRKINFNELLKDIKVRRRLVLKTSEGKCVVENFSSNYWDPHVDFFKNHTTAVAQPIRSTYKERAYGSNVKYLIELKYKGGSEQVIGVRSGDYQSRIFTKFALTADSLSSKKNLETYLIQMMLDGKLVCEDLTVYDLEEWRNSLDGIKPEGLITAPKRNWFVYEILGRIDTIQSNYRMRKSNKALASKKT